MIPRLRYSILGALACILLAGAGSPSWAQQRIGYVNTDTILQQVPEYQGIQRQLDILSQEWRQQLDEMQQEIERLRQDYESKEILYSDEVRAEKQAQIRQRETARQQYLSQKFGPEGDYFQKQKELLEPIQRRVYEAVRMVAERQNIDFVFDRARNSSLLFGQKQWNLNEEVLQELDVTLQE